MTEIKIKRLSLENFKCHKALTLNLEGGNASIYGDNATGKTSVYDALVWLLFDKDSSGNGSKNFEIKPLGPTGEVMDHDALTAVEAVLLVNGEEVSLRRTYKEVWTTKRGSSEATYDGNTSEYFVDGVPCKRNAFQAKVNDLVDEDTFRMLTSVSHFAAGISWQERRKVLFQVAGVMDDSMILATDQKFQPLVEAMGRLSVEDYKRKLLSEKKQYTGIKSELPARISECEKTITDIQGLDFAGAKAEKERLGGKLVGVDEQIAAIRNSTAARAKELEIREAKGGLTALEQENNAHRLNQQAALEDLERENRAYRDSQKSGVDTNALKAGVRTMAAQLEIKRGQHEREKKYIDGRNQDVAQLRLDWIAANNVAFSGGNCPTCGQALPAEALKQAKDTFEAEKKRKLDSITRQAGSHTQSIEAARERLKAMEEDISRFEADIQAQEQAIAEAEANTKPIVDLPDYAERKKPVTDMADYDQRKQAILDTIEKLEGELFELNTNSSAALAPLEAEKAQIRQLIQEQDAILSKQSVLAYAKGRVEELRANAKAASEKLDGIEQMLWLIDEYSRYKTRFVEDSINGMFRIARFRLFREQANGGVEERCDVVHEGVPYIGVNNGMKINLGIDIINTLGAAYGVRVPLFVDNAESVTCLEASASQIIRLVVSENDKELRVNYEN